MTRLSALLLSALIAAAPLSAANAQDRGGRGDRGNGNGQEFQREQRRISEAEAQSIAISRAGGGTRLVGSKGLQGNSYIFRFERRLANGQNEIFDIAVDSRG